MRETRAMLQWRPWRWCIRIWPSESLVQTFKISIWGALEWVQRIGKFPNVHHVCQEQQTIFAVNSTPVEHLPPESKWLSLFSTQQRHFFLILPLKVHHGPILWIMEYWNNLNTPGRFSKTSQTSSTFRHFEFSRRAILKVVQHLERPSCEASVAGI